MSGALGGGAPLGGIGEIEYTCPVKRTPKGYEGTGLTTRLIGDLLPQIVSRISKKKHEPVKDLLNAWTELAGEKVACYSEAVSFVDGVLTVKVRSSVLYSVLCQSEGPRLLALMQERFPTVQKITFRRG